MCNLAALASFFVEGVEALLESLSGRSNAVNGNNIFFENRRRKEDCCEKMYTNILCMRV